MATRREALTLGLAGVGAVSGLASLSAIVWEKLKYPSRVEMQSLSFFRDYDTPLFLSGSQSGPPQPRIGLMGGIGYRNDGKLFMRIDSYPLLTVRHPDGRTFGPYLMRPQENSFGIPGGPVTLEPLGSSNGFYALRGFGRAIANGEIPDIRARFNDFTFEVVAEVREQGADSYVVRLVQSFAGEQVHHDQILFDPGSVG